MGGAQPQALEQDLNRRCDGDVTRLMASFAASALVDIPAAGDDPYRDRFTTKCLQKSSTIKKTTNAKATRINNQITASSSAEGGGLDAVSFQLDQYFSDRRRSNCFNPTIAFSGRLPGSGKCVVDRIVLFVSDVDPHAQPPLR